MNDDPTKGHKLVPAPDPSTCTGCAMNSPAGCMAPSDNACATGGGFIWIKEEPVTTVPGRKDDSGKLDVTLLFDDLPHALEAVTEVLQWAVTKKQPTPYERGSWQGVSDFQRRYRAAQLRHMLNAAKAKIDGGVEASELARDYETGLLELAHVATDALFQLEMVCRKLKGAG